MSEDLWPSEIRLRADRRALAVRFGEGQAVAIPAELLRVESPSAEVQGHSPLERKLVPGKSGVAITSVEPIGHYAVRLVFDDGHSTGIYDWRYLARLADDPAGKLDAYRAELAGSGLSHDPAR